MALYQIRAGFTIIVGGIIYRGGDSIDLNPSQYLDHAHKLEGVANNVVNKVEPYPTIFVSNPIGFSTGSSAIFTHGFKNFSAVSSSVLVNCFLMCKETDRGYSPGALVNQFEGVNYELKSTQIVVYLASTGVFVMDAYIYRRVRVDPSKWNLIVKAVRY